MGQTAGSTSLGAQLEERYFLQKVKLGQGSFGTVWRAVDRHSGSTVAIKQLDKASLPRRGVTKLDIEREISMMKACIHENITQLKDTFEDEKNIYLALEYCDGGDFGDKVKERGMAAVETEVAEWMRQMCAAIAAMHSRGICHRDVKPDNFMVQSGNEGAGANSGKLKLSDFGLAIYVPQNGKLLQEKCGTPAFMSPEQHHLPKRSPGYSFPADVWAVGVSMYMMMFGGKHPFLNDKGGLDDQMLLNGELDFRDQTQKMGFFGLAGLAGASLRFSEEARSLCKRMVEPDPTRRITAEDTAGVRWLQTGKDAANAAAKEVPRPSSPAVGGGRAATPPAIAPIVDLDKTMQQPPREERCLTPRNTPPRRQAERDDKKKEEEAPPRTSLKSRPERERSVTPGPEGRKAMEKLAEENKQLASELEERKRREEDLMLKQQQHEMQKKLFEKRKTKELEDIEKKKAAAADEIAKKKAASDEQLHILQFQREAWELEKQKAKQAAEAMAKAGTAALAPLRVRLGEEAQAHGASSSNAPSRDSVSRNRSAPDKTAMPEKVRSAGSPVGRGKLLRQGTKCRYQSGTYGWMPTVVQSYNDSNGTYNLDVRQHAALDKIAPCKDVNAAEAWPPGTLASYLSATVSEWLPARVVSFNESDFTYNLDVRDHAEVDRIRARTEKPNEGRPENETGMDARRTMNGRNVDEHRTMGGAEASGGRRNKGVDDEDSFGRGRGGGRDFEATTAGAMTTSPSSGSTRLVSRGDIVWIPDQGLACIDSTVGRDGCYTVKISDTQKIHVKAEVMRAPKEAKFAWPPGTKVSYLSASVGKWIEAHVVSFNPSNSTYNLDVRLEAAPDKVRPR